MSLEVIAELKQLKRFFRVNVHLFTPEAVHSAVTELDRRIGIQEAELEKMAVEYENDALRVNMEIDEETEELKEEFSRLSREHEKLDVDAKKEARYKLMRLEEELRKRGVVI